MPLEIPIFKMGCFYDIRQQEMKKTNVKKRKKQMTLGSSLFPQRIRKKCLVIRDSKKCIL